jgi:holo-[acyl-carrier protein] synthase
MATRTLRVHGIGVDLVSLPRFRRFAGEHETRLPEMFTRGELARGTEKMAAAFAVKEAALKAIGGLTGWELDWREIGSPSRDGAVALTGAVAAHAKTLGIVSVAASVTAFGDFVMASVIVESRTS